MKLSYTQTQARSFLKTVIRPSSTIVINQTHVSRSGMQRRLKLYIIKKNGLQEITHAAADLLQWSENHDGIKVDGCGMDMHFHTIDVLSGLLFQGTKKSFKGNGGSCLAWRSL